MNKIAVIDMLQQLVLTESCFKKDNFKLQIDEVECICSEVCVSLCGTLIYALDLLTLQTECICTCLALMAAYKAKSL